MLSAIFGTKINPVTTLFEPAHMTKPGAHRPISALSKQSGRSTKSNDSAVRAIARALRDATASKAKTCINYAKLSTAVFVPLAAVGVLCAITLTIDKQRMEESAAQQGFVTSGKETAALVASLQKERGRSCQYLQPLENMASWIPTAADGKEFTRPESLLSSLQKFRSSIDQHSTLTCDIVLEWYTDRTTILNNAITGAFQKTADGVFWTTVSAYGDLLSAKDILGLCRALGGSFFAAGGFKTSELVQFTMYHGSAFRIIDAVVNRTPGGSVLYGQLKANHSQLIETIKQAMAIILANNISGPDAEAGLVWFSNMTSYMSMFDGLGNLINNVILDYLDRTVSTADSNIVRTVVIVVIISLLCPPIMIWYSVNNQKLMANIRGYIRLVFAKTDELNREKRKTEMILSQMLPASIVADLKQNKPIMPEHYDAVTLFFSDVHGFTALAFKCNPLQIIDLLNGLYTTMDSILDRYEVYKVETISDSYMVASGLPHRNGNKHASEVCTMALDMLMTMESFRIPHMQQYKLLLRIGIHTGPLATGVVGLKMPRYCLFGDTVNTASRMETTGEHLAAVDVSNCCRLACKIQISENTKVAVDRDGDNFDILARGSIDVKGKGQLRTYWLLGRSGFPFRVDIAKADQQLLKHQYWL